MTAKRPRFGLDTNILVYAVDLAGGEKATRAELVIRHAAATRRCVLTLQNIGEFYHVSARKRHASPEIAARRAADFGRLFPVIEARMDDVGPALAAAASGRFSYWDALLLTTLDRAGCAVVLSEDMHDGATLGGVTVRDPFGGPELREDLRVLLS